MSKQYISEKAQERIFNVILKRLDNQSCADCQTKGPRWVSLDYGVFICMDCAGAHRTLGPSVTRVRSTNIDGWYQENIDLMEALGNAVANSYWENQIPKGYCKPTINQGLDALIRYVQEKYVKKKFIPLVPCEDPKSFYIKTMKSVKPYYFQQEVKSPPLQTVKVKLGDLIDMDGDDNCFNQQPPDYLTFDQSKQSQNGTNTAHSLSPEKDLIIQQNISQPPTQSLPSLDIMNLYKNSQQQPHMQSQNFQQKNNQGNANYAYLQNYQRVPNQMQQQQQQQQQQYQYQMNQVPQWNNQQTFKQNAPINILDLYGQKN